MRQGLSLKKHFFCKIVEFWLKSLRISFQKPDDFSQGILALWHRDLAAATAAFRKTNLTAFISQSEDGEQLARIALDLGYRVVRGSGTAGILQVRKLLSELAAGNACAMALDGPTGPAGIEKPGTRWLAQKSGKPVWLVKVRYGARITLSSWDRARIPLPFSKVQVQIQKLS